MATTYTRLLYHLVFSTRHRKPLISQSLQEPLYQYVGGIVRRQEGVLLEIGGIPDHVHLVVRLKPNISIAALMRCIKANSSKWVNEERELTDRFGWQRGYGAFTVGHRQLDRVVAYVRRQEEHHGQVSFQAEILHLLDRHGIEHDERYLWD